MSVARMTRADLLQQFKTTAGEIAEKDFARLGEDGVIADLGIDSLGLLEIIGNLERDLDIRVPDDQLVGIQTVKQLLDLVEKRLTA